MEKEKDVKVQLKAHEKLKLDELARAYRKNKSRQLEIVIYEDSKRLLGDVLSRRGWYIEPQEFLGLADVAVSLALKHFEVSSSFTSYLCLLFVRDFIDFLRTDAVRKRAIIFPGFPTGEPPDCGTSDPFSEIEMRDYVNYVRSNVSEKSWNCLQLSFHGYTYKEIEKMKGYKDPGDTIFRDRKKVEKLKKEESDEVH